MVMFKAHTKAAGMIVAAALLAALCTAFAHHSGLCIGGGKPLYQSSGKLRPRDIRDYVGGVADEAAAQAEAEALEGRRQSVVAEADAQLGVPYSYGGTTPSGFDCSGFTRWVFSHALGRELPRTAAEQSALGIGRLAGRAGARRPSVLGKSGSGVYHVGIYAGDGEYIHASTGGGRVMRATFDYFAPDFAKRVID